MNKQEFKKGNWAVICFDGGNEFFTAYNTKKEALLQAKHDAKNTPKHKKNEFYAVGRLDTDSEGAFCIPNPVWSNYKNQI